MSMIRYKRYFQLSFIMLSAALIVAGVMRKEVFDIIANAKILCFSCIGLK